MAGIAGIEMERIGAVLIEDEAMAARLGIMEGGTAAEQQLARLLRGAQQEFKALGPALERMEEAPKDFRQQLRSLRGWAMDMGAEERARMWSIEEPFEDPLEDPLEDIPEFEPPGEEGPRRWVPIDDPLNDPLDDYPEFEPPEEGKNWLEVDRDEPIGIDPSRIADRQRIITRWRVQAVEGILNSVTNSLNRSGAAVRNFTRDQITRALSFRGFTPETLVRLAERAAMFSPNNPGLSRERLNRFLLETLSAGGGIEVLRRAPEVASAFGNVGEDIRRLVESAFGIDSSADDKRRNEEITKLRKEFNDGIVQKFEKKIETEVIRTGQGFGAIRMNETARRLMDAPNPLTGQPNPTSGPRVPSPTDPSSTASGSIESPSTPAPTPAPARSFFTGRDFPPLDGSVLNTIEPGLPLGRDDLVIPRSLPTEPTPLDPNSVIGGNATGGRNPRGRRIALPTFVMEGDNLSERPNDERALVRRSSIPVERDVLNADGSHPNNTYSPAVDPRFALFIQEMRRSAAKRDEDYSQFWHNATHHDRDAESMVPIAYDTRDMPAVPSSVDTFTVPEWRPYENSKREEPIALTDAPAVVGVGFDEHTMEQVPLPDFPQPETTTTTTTTATPEEKTPDPKEPTVLADVPTATTTTNKRPREEEVTPNIPTRQPDNINIANLSTVRTGGTSGVREAMRPIRRTFPAGTVPSTM